MKLGRLPLRYWVAGIFCAGAVLALSVYSYAAPFSDSGIPVNFQAKQLLHDDQKQTVTAIGDVELVQGQKILRADKMVYNLATDTVSAIGNVSLLDETGDIHFAEYVELTTNMKEGFVHELLSLLADGSRFTAAEAKREEGIRTTMTDATYTPCKVCEANPEPVWQLKADKVVHDEQEKSVRYKNARLEVLGVPLAYSPIFSHADPSVKRKSGFLRPDYGWGSETGSFVEGGYYFGNISPDKDATLKVRPSTLGGTLVQGQWRQRFERGRVEVNASGVSSDRTEEDGRVEENRLRGHIFADGRYDIDDQWRAGFGVRRASDKSFLRLYDISNENVLRNYAYAERFAGRDYSRIMALNFQDVRLGVRPDQPDAIPSAEHRMIGSPGSLLGGRWEAGVSSLILHRDLEGQDVQRGSTDIGWEKRHIFSNGLKTLVNASARGDLYAVQDNVALPPDSSTEAARAHATAGLTAGYPLTRRFSNARVILEPVVGLRATSHVDENDTDIPNEDSVDIQFDANNLFEENRFPGFDRIEDGARVDYGLRTSAHRDDGGYVRTFIGQSRRFDDDNVFPTGSGLEENDSDVVGQVNVGLNTYFTGDYRFQLDSDDLSVKRHELMASGKIDRLSAYTRYIYADVIQGTGFTETREQVLLGGGYKINDNWSTSGSALTDLGEEPGLRRAKAGAYYADECFSFAVEGVRNLTSDAAGESETVLMMRIGLKNIGEFSAPEIALSGQQPE